jgi:hypothetical protein
MSECGWEHGVRIGLGTSPSDRPLSIDFTTAREPGCADEIFVSLDAVPSENGIGELLAFRDKCLDVSGVWIYSSAPKQTEQAFQNISYPTYRASIDLDTGKRGAGYAKSSIAF